MAVAAVVAGQVAFAGNPLADLQAGDTGAHGSHLTHIFVADGHRGLDVQLGPGIPVENVNVSTADGGLVNLNKNLTGAGNRHGNLPQFQAGAGSGLNDGVHKLSHV